MENSTRLQVDFTQLLKTRRGRDLHWSVKMSPCRMTVKDIKKAGGKIFTKNKNTGMYILNLLCKVVSKQAIYTKFQ